MKRYITGHVAGLPRPVELPEHMVSGAATGSIDGAGGRLRIPEAGLTITIPEGALSAPCSFNVGVHPRVHGFTVIMSPPQTLAKRATIEVEIPEDADVRELVLGHTAHIGVHSICSEFFAVTIGDGPTGRVATAHVPHFSGYIFAGGLQAGQPCDPEIDGPMCVWVDDS